MKIVMGLGNPGPAYQRTRHNAGAEIVRELGRRLAVDLSHHTLKSEWGRGRQAGETVVLACPTTYMNCSGEAAAALLRYFKCPPSQMLVVVDDLNLPLGTLRFRNQGSDGGHNGLKSIMQFLNSNEFPRLRVGIGRPPERMAVTDFVLGKFSPAENEVLQPVLIKAVAAVDSWLEHGMERAMQEYN